MNVIKLNDREANHIKTVLDLCGHENFNIKWMSNSVAQETFQRRLEPEDYELILKNFNSGSIFYNAHTGVYAIMAQGQVGSFTHDIFREKEEELKEKTPDLGSIFREVDKSGNGSIYTEIVECSTVKYRIEIRKDSYDPQSYGKVSYWNGQWIFVHSIKHPSMKTRVLRAEMKDFQDDGNSLLETARKIVEGM
jgi:hypothetical protein